MKRKVLSVFVIIALLCGIISPAMAQGESAKISQDQAMKIARDTLGIPDLKNVNMSYREEGYPYSKKVWEFMWDDSKFGKWHNYRVEVDADSGEILSYSEDQDWNQYVRPKKTKSEVECKNIAEGFLKKISPEKFNQIKEMEIPGKDRNLYQYGPKRYDFTYHRVVNGIAFTDNNMSISINADNGKVMSYYCNWDTSVSFPKALPIVTPAEAEKIFKEKVGLKLNYMQFGYSPFAAKKPVQLYYSMWENYGPSGMIDSATGNLIDYTGKEITVQNKVYLTAKPEPDPVNGDEKTITADEAKAKIKEFIVIPGDYSLRSTRYSEGWGPGAQKIWEFQFGPADFKGGASIYVTVNAVTGDLVNYNRWDETFMEKSEHKAQYDYDSCKKIASEFLKKMAPAKVEYAYLVEPMTKPVWYNNGKAVDPPTYNFNFVRVVNGILFSSNQIGIDVDNTTGEIRGFWSNWDQSQKFSDPENVITEKEALDNLFAVEKPNLVYTYKQSENGSPSREVMLVYRMFNDIPKVVDASSGKVSGLYELENPVILEDVQGHWAEGDIRTLASWGIVAGANNKFNPDKTITRAEFVNMLVMAKGLEIEEKATQTFTDVSPDSWYFGTVEAAAKAGLIKGSGDKFSPNKTITRQEIVVMLMNAANSGQQVTVRENLAGFKDSSKVAIWAKQQVAQAVEMGILAGSNGYLKPTDPATRAQAAVMLTKIISGNNKPRGYSSKYISARW